MCYSHFAVFVLFSVLLTASVTPQSTDEEDDFIYSKGPVPNSFQPGQRYPDRDEDVECQPIRLRAERGSKSFQSLVSFTGTSVHFKTQNSRIMSSRLHDRLNKLATSYKNKYNIKLYILKAWTEYKDAEVPDRSLHYEGRSVRIHVTSSNVTALLKLAVTDADFDWVQYHTDGYATLSVIPDVCDINVDMVFVSDQSGSVGPTNNKVALNFISGVVDFFTIGADSTQVGLVTYSTHAKVRFDLDDYHSKSQIQNAISKVGFPGGWTATALGLFQAGVFLNPTEKRGARPSSAGIPKIVVLITDGRSNILPIDEVSQALHAAGVQVFTVGIGNIHLPELRQIASDPDSLHVFLLNSFNDASGFIDFLSFTACKAPAIVEPGENTTTEVQEDGFRFFQTECTAFSASILIEQIDIQGQCSLYASDVVANPGPLDDYSLVVRNEDKKSDRRSVLLKIKQKLKKVIYISVRGLTSSNMFSVIIWDKLFTKDHFLVYAPEGVINSQIFDLDQELTVVTERFKYSIKEGNEGGEFEIDPITGILTVLKPLTIADRKYYDLFIVAENINASCHRGRVKVTVIVVDNALELLDSTANMPEDILNNTIVTTVQAQGGTGVIQYSIVSGNENGVFAIDEDNGTVTVVDPTTIDFETTPEYVLTIRAVSTPVEVAVTATLTITVTDVNERPLFVTPCAIEGSCTFEVLENQTAGLFVGTVNATDPDRSTVANGQLSYTITPTTEPFTIDDSGRIRALVLDREAESSHEFTVTVTDGGDPALSVSTTVTVTVLDINDNKPVFNTGFSQLPLLEDTPLIDLTQYSATDADINSAPITYSLTSNQPDLPFAIDPATGVLSLVSALDFESEPRVYNFDVVATDSGGLSTSFPVISEVIDVNDNTPQFTQRTYTASVTENSPIGTDVEEVSATDLDSGLNGEIKYAIISGNSDNLFAIDSATGAVTTNASIDREAVMGVTLTIEARDMGQPSRVNTTTLTITITDVNDNAPIFSPSNVQLSVPEDQAIGNLVQLMATDRDQPNTPNSDIVYSIQSGNSEGAFAINSTSGSLKLVKSLDFETTESYSLVIIASDKGVPVMRSNITVPVNVLNVNDNPPIVSGNQDESVFESEPVGFTVAQFQASDLDQSTLSFSFGEGTNSDGIFAINNNGKVTLQKMLDFETAERHELTVVVSDGLQSTSSTLRVNVIDVNEFSPVFTSSNQFQVTEEQPAGTLVGTVSATDSDTAQTVTYTLAMSSSLFSIDSSTGQITTSVVLDREVLGEDGVFPPPDSQLQINVVATDNGVIPGTRSTTSPVTITLLDINDNSPVFDSPSYQVDVSENATIGTSELTVIAEDADLGNNGLITYSISSDSSTPLPFTINSETGEITVTQSLDRETDSYYIIDVTATDSGLPTPRSTTVGLLVNITDVNDNVPTLGAAVITETLPETAALGVAVFLVAPIDLDIGVNAEVDYVIQGRDQCSAPSDPIPDPCFFIVTRSAEGKAEFQLERSLDFETKTQHTIVVTASDRGIPTLSSNTTFIINVQNIDEVKPVFTGPCDGSVPEHSPVGTFIVSCIATDIDDVTQTQSNNIQYTITAVVGQSGDSFTGLFDISETGNITTAVNTLDREDEPSYRIAIQARDAAGNIESQIGTITITDVNDNTLTFLNAPYSVDVTAEFLSSYEQDLITIETRDTDTGANAEVMSFSHSVVKDPVTSIVTVTATDSGTPPLTNSTNVSVNFVDSPCEIQSYSIRHVPGTQNAVLSGQFICSISVTPASVIQLVGERLELHCNVLRNVDVTARFFISTNGGTVHSGDLTSGQSSLELVRESAMETDSGTYQCLATSADSGGIQTQVGSVVEILPPVEVSSGPGEVTAELGSEVFLSCSSNMNNRVSWEWFNGPTSTPDDLIVSDNLRVFTIGRSLFLTEAVLDDTGEYTCEATNPVSSDQKTGTLTVYEEPDVVQVIINDHTDPDPENDCNSFNDTQFQDSMSSITGQKTLSTNVTGDNMCPPDACHPNPCLNNAECQLTPTTSTGYTCVCLAGYTGPTCAEDVNECVNASTCLHNGVCVNTPGAYTCECPEDTFGDNCEYIHSECKCPPTHECVQGIEGLPDECVGTVQSSSGFLLVEDPVQQNTALLDQTVNTYNEDPPSGSGKRRKRDTFVTTCAGKFIRSVSNPNNYLLTWICPDGVQPPNEVDLVGLCHYLISRRLVGSCIAPTGESITIPTVKPSNVNVSFIMIDGNNANNLRPLSAPEVLVILEDTQALDKMKDNGYNALEFHQLVPASASESASSGSTVGGAVGGIIISLIIILIVVIIAFLVVKYRKKKYIQRTSESISYSLKLGPSVNIGGDDEDRYVRRGGPMIPLTDKSTTYVISTKVPNNGGTSPTSPTNPYTSFFDDPTYEVPSVVATKKKKKIGTLSKTESKENLLGDEEAPPTPPDRTTSLKTNESEIEDEPIYGNMGFQHHDQNIGARWENYQKTQTILQGVKPNYNKYT